MNRQKSSVSKRSKHFAHVAKNAQGGDIVCVFSNGGFGGIHSKLLERLGRR
jgi:UDP-N-acetylmuramate-alanine ligase